MYQPKPKWWDQQQSPAACVVRFYGGVGATAKALGRAESSVSAWEGRGTVPQELWPKILDTSTLTVRTLLYGKRTSKARGK